MTRYGILFPIAHVFRKKQNGRMRKDTDHRRTRTALGPHFSEGARLMWLALRERGQSDYAFSKEFGVGRSTVLKWLYGDSLPSRLWGIEIERLLGIAPGLFDVPPKRAFVLPGASVRKATPSSPPPRAA